MNRTCGQRCRLAVRMQGPGGRVDAKHTDAVLAALRRNTRGWRSVARTSVAPSDVEILSRWMRPSVLDIGRERHRTSFGQGAALDVYVVLRKLGADGGVQRHLVLGPSNGRGEQTDGRE